MDGNDETDTASGGNGGNAGYGGNALGGAICIIGGSATVISSSLSDDPGQYGTPSTAGLGGPLEPPGREM